MCLRYTCCLQLPLVFKHKYSFTPLTISRPLESVLQNTVHERQQATQHHTSLAMALPSLAQFLIILLVPPLHCKATSEQAPIPTEDSSIGSEASGTATTRSRLDLWQHLPTAWRSICNADYDSDADVNGTLRCRVTSEGGVGWRLADLREALNETFVSANALQVQAAWEGYGPVHLNQSPWNAING